MAKFKLVPDKIVKKRVYDDNCKKLESRFIELFKQKYGMGTFFNGKDRKQVEFMIDKIGPENSIKLVEFVFKYWEDLYHKISGPTVGYCLAFAPSLLPMALGKASIPSNFKHGGEYDNEKAKEQPNIGW
jgi:hypothetical protein